MSDAEKKLTAINYLKVIKENTDETLKILKTQNKNVNVTLNKNNTQVQTPQVQQKQVEPVMWIPSKIRYITERQVFYMGCSGWTPEQIAFVSDKTVAEIKEAYNHFGYNHPDLVARYKQFGSL